MSEYLEYVVDHPQSIAVQKSKTGRSLRPALVAEQDSGALQEVPHKPWLRLLMTSMAQLHRLTLLTQIASSTLIGKSNAAAPRTTDYCCTLSFSALEVAFSPA